MYGRITRRDRGGNPFPHGARPRKVLRHASAAHVPTPKRRDVGREFPNNAPQPFPTGWRTSIRPSHAVPSTPPCYGRAPRPSMPWEGAPSTSHAAHPNPSLTVPAAQPSGGLRGREAAQSVVGRRNGVGVEPQAGLLRGRLDCWPPTGLQELAERGSTGWYTCAWDRPRKLAALRGVSVPGKYPFPRATPSGIAGAAQPAAW